MDETNAKQRLPKGRRVPEAFANRKLTERALAIIEIIGRYRFVTSSDIARLAGGNEDVTYRHLQHLYHRNLVSRLQLAVGPTNGQFIYFLENATALRELVANNKVATERLDFEEIHQNHSKYRTAPSIGQMLFLEHELMISHFRAELELASASIRDRATIHDWEQGPPTWQTVVVPPQTVRDGSSGSLPVRPDAYFVLKFTNAPEGQQFSRFFYEADRDTSNGPRFRLKLLAYVYFFLTGAYSKEFHARKVRAVLVETTSQARMEQLRRIAAELATTEPLAAPLFWFTTSGLIREKGILSAAWQTGFDGRPRTLLD